MSRRHRDALHLYRCADCGYHHVGHIVPAWQRTPSIASRTAASRDNPERIGLLDSGWIEVKPRAGRVADWPERLAFSMIGS